ncbi:MAG: glycosyltransferase [Vulcanimicrobiaceae bacterium]
MSPAAPRVAIVSDPLVQRGGAERVVEAMAELFPDAPVYALLYSPETGPAALRARVTASSLGRVPGAARRHRWLLPFYPAAIERFDLRGFDAIVSSHHTVAKGVLRGADQVHVCYCHTPMRALWERPHDELAAIAAPLRPFAERLLSRLRAWDLATAARVDRFVANSATTQRRIRAHYGRDSAIVYPPIDTDRFTPGGEAQDYYLVASRLVPYKRIDVALAAAAMLGRRVLVAGSAGEDRRLAMPGVELLGHVDDDRLVALMRGARGLLFPQYEDFGMTPVEMMACGRPVVAYGRGGALETVIDGVTGVLADDQTPLAFASAMRRLESQSWSSERIRRHAERFSKARFNDGLAQIVARAWAQRDEPARFAGEYARHG